MTATAGIDRILEQLSRCLDAESTRRLLEFEIDPDIQARVDELAERANDGALTDQERDEYEAFIDMANFISLLQLSAKQRLHSAHS